MNVPFMNLSLLHQSINGELSDAFSRTMNSNHFIGGPEVKAFEEEFAHYCGTKHAIGVGNGTDSLFLLLKCMGVGPADNVVTVANTFIASAECIDAVGARPVFIDVDPQTMNIDLDRLDKYCSQAKVKPKVVIAVHLYGRILDMDRLMSLSEKHGFKVIEDSAQAHGAKWNGKTAGSIGHAGSFSFYPGKNLGAMGDAGCVTTNDADLAKSVRMLANHGRISKYDHEFAGFNSRLDGLQAAFLRVKLKKMKEWNEDRKIIADRYFELLTPLEGRIQLPQRAPADSHVYHLFVIRIENREAVQKALQEKGIETGIHYPIALPFLKAYKRLGYTERDFPVAAQLQSQVLSLPFFPYMKIAEQEYVVQQLKNFV